MALNFPDDLDEFGRVYSKLLGQPASLAAQASVPATTGDQRADERAQILEAMHSVEAKLNELLARFLCCGNCPMRKP